MTTLMLVVITLVVVALIFDFTNGFHDAANSIATVVATGTLTPLQAVSLAAFFNFVAMWIFELKIAATIGKGIVDPGVVDLYVLFGCLTGAITWNMITWWFGLPTSSSHAIIGGLVGATVAKAGIDPLIDGGIIKVAAFILVAPVLGFILGAGISTVLKVAVPENKATERWFKWLQVISASLYSLGHGTNDAQKTAGVIFLILIAGGYLTKTDAIPFWVVFSSFAVMGLGTLAGGWRIVQTLGYKLTALNPRSGFAAEGGGSMMLFGASALGIPVSTTHTITGAILGVGSAQREPEVNWGVAGRILIAWIITIPASAMLAAAFWVASMTVAGHF
jgi:PiT family inorganic phosphate transporter